MVTVEFIKRLYDWQGDARLYKLSEPVPHHVWLDGGEEGEEETEHVVVSAVVAMAGPETYIFPADKSGRTDFNEMTGSTRGTLQHKTAIENAGWRLAPNGAKE